MKNTADTNKKVIRCGRRYRGHATALRPARPRWEDDSEEDL